MNKYFVAGGVGLLAIAAVATWVITIPGVAQLFETAVGSYCQIPQGQRLIIRNEVAAVTAPNRIEVHCAGDN